MPRGQQFRLSRGRAAAEAEEEVELLRVGARQPRRPQGTEVPHFPVQAQDEGPEQERLASRGRARAQNSRSLVQCQTEGAL